MNEIRKELERQFKAQRTAAEENAKKSEAENGVVCEAAEVPNGAENTEQVVICISAPKGYLPEFAEDFKNLSPKWQEFLNQREQEYENNLNEIINKLQGYQWVDDIFKANEPRLCHAGISKVKDWLEGLAFVDAAMNEKPEETLRALAVVYGVDDAFCPSDGNVSKDMISRLCRLERSYHQLTSYLQQQRYQKLVEAVNMFGGQTDREGRPLHPYFNDVLPQIFELLQSGAVADVDSAYNKALWLHPHIRQELISQIINSRAAEAEKAKKAAFSPKGKAKAPQRELTLREELEKNMAAFMS